MDRPEVVVFDGITLGTVKQLPDPVLELDTNQRLPLIPQSLRVFLPSTAHRKAISEYLLDGLSLFAFKELVDSIGQKPLTDYIQFSSTVEGNSVLCHDKLIREVLHYFSRNDPISGVFQFAILEYDELVMVVRLSKGKFVRESILVTIFRKMFTLEKLLLSMKPKREIDNEGIMLVALHPIICTLLTWIMFRMETLFSTQSRVLLPSEASSNDDFSFYFPAKTKYK